MIKFKTTLVEDKLITKIAQRAYIGLDNLNLKQSFLTTKMDLKACHANGCELNFEKLLNFDYFDFSHDILGIIKNINRETGEIENCFLPRSYNREINQ